MSQTVQGLGFMIWIAQANDYKHRYVEQAKGTDRLEPKGEWQSY